MSVFADKSKQIASIDINKILRNVLKKSDVQIFALDLNRKDQLFIEGEDSQGVKLGKYTLFTEQENTGRIFNYKGASKSKTKGEPYSLYDSGSWYSSFKLIVNNKDFDIIANPFIEDTNVFERFGENVVGLTEKSICKLTDYIRERVIQEVKREATR